MINIKDIENELNSKEIYDLEEEMNEYGFVEIFFSNTYLEDVNVYRYKLKGDRSNKSFLVKVVEYYRHKTHKYKVTIMSPCDSCRSGTNGHIWNPRKKGIDKCCLKLEECRYYNEALTYFQKHVEY